MKTRIAVFLCLNFLLCSIGFAQEEKFESWKKEREEELLQEDGWINLVGLFWIDEEKAFLNQVSRDSLVVSFQPTENNVGAFQFSEDSVWFIFNPKLSKIPNLRSPPKSLAYPLEYGKGGGVYFERWKWTVINRGGQYAMRLRDLDHPEIENFQAVPYFEYDPNFRMKAFFEPKFNQTMNITNVLGQEIEWNVMGILKFELNGMATELTVLDELGKFFVIFSDQTNALDTYPTGRYLYVDYPDRTGNTILDFNYSYNPPCAFTAFATCPIPPKENRLNLSILAGEKMPQEH
jgi:uncharacterized protein